MKFNINGEEFIVDEFPEGWGWSSDKSEGDFFYPNACQAQQDAIDQVQNRLNEENQVWDDAGMFKKPVYQDEDWNR